MGGGKGDSACAMGQGGLSLPEEQGSRGTQHPGGDQPCSELWIPRSGGGRASGDPHSCWSGAHTDVGEGQLGLC